MNARTEEIRVCRVCENGNPASFKFCRQCGAIQVAPPTVLLCEEGSNAEVVRRNDYQVISGALVSSVISSRSSASLRNRSRLEKTILQAFISIPILLLLVLIAPFEAYGATREILEKA